MIGYYNYTVILTYIGTVFGFADHFAADRQRLVGKRIYGLEDRGAEFLGILAGGNSRHLHEQAAQRQSEHRLLAAVASLEQMQTSPDKRGYPDLLGHYRQLYQIFLQEIFTYFQILQIVWWEKRSPSQ